MARTTGIAARENEGFRFYDEQLQWSNPLFAGGYEFMDPPPLVTKDGVKPLPTTGARKLNARASFFYLATGITPAMCMRLPNIGSQYIGTFYDAKGEAFDGAKTYKLVLPKDIPAGKFWSLTLYDNQHSYTTRWIAVAITPFPKNGRSFRGSTTVPSGNRTTK